MGYTSEPTRRSAASRLCTEARPDQTNHEAKLAPDAAQVGIVIALTRKPVLDFAKSS